MHWMRASRISLSSLQEATVRRFLEEHVPVCTCPVSQGSRCHQKSALSRLLSVARTRGYVTTRSKPPTAVDSMLGRFSDHLENTCGTTTTTRRRYLWVTRRFLLALGHARVAHLRDLTPADVLRLMVSESDRLSPRTAETERTALRSFLRFAALHRLCSSRLADAVPRVRRYRLASLPKSLSEPEISSLLASFDRASPAGLRDYAITSCLLNLGLRAGDVATLTLDDLDLRAGTLRLVVDKRRRAATLPLPPAVGRAIIAYLRRGRPRTDDRHVFVTHVLPRGRPINTPIVTTLVRRAFARAGLRTAAKGPHSLRHTAATKMVRAGTSLKEVADVLRHRSLSSVMIYTKVDLPRLTEVALPWPEAVQ
jgi:site-specific recombinase XerD